MCSFFARFLLVFARFLLVFNYQQLLDKKSYLLLMKNKLFKNKMKLFYKNFKKEIDWEKYKEYYNDLKDKTQDELKIHYYKFGRYENRVIILKKKVWAHLYIYNINKFNEFYSEYIDIIMNNYNVIITYKEGNIIPIYNFKKRKKVDSNKFITNFLKKNKIKLTLYISANNYIDLIKIRKFLKNYEYLLKNYKNYNIYYKGFFYKNDINNDTKNINIQNIDYFVSIKRNKIENTELFTNSNGFNNKININEFIKFIKKSKYNNLTDFLEKSKKTNFLVIDMILCNGGAYMYLQNLISKYKKNINFLILREFNNVYCLTVNDDIYLNIYNLEDFDIEYKKNEKKINNIFINSIVTNSKEFNNYIFSLNKYKIAISHDFSLLYKEIQPIKINNLTSIYLEDNYDLIISQTRTTSDNLKLNNNIIIDMPDYYQIKDLYNYKNNKINICVLGNVSEIKGNHILKDFINFLKEKDIILKYDFKIFGKSHPYLKEYANPYNSINDLNEKLIEYKPNVILETSIWPETWSYTLTLAKTTNLPIFYLKKKINSCIKERLKFYNKAYEWTNFESLIFKINKYKQDYLFTIKNNLIFPKFYNSLFENKYIENLIIISSKIEIVNNNYGFLYCSKKSIYSQKKRYYDTLKTIKSIRDKFNNYNHKIILIDNSSFNNNELKEIKSSVDIFLGRENIRNIDYYTNECKLKAIAECSQINEINNYIIKNNITFKNMFKITGRYILNENFSFERFNNNKNNFKLAVEIINKKKNIKDYFYTCFYKINYNYFDIFVIAIKSIMYDEKIYVNNVNLEEILPNKIKKLSEKNTILNIKTLGLTQNISVWEKKKYIIKI
jgi:hypothetical protein